jgi:hypothetical protein
MRQSTLVKLALLVFALVFVSFLIRGFGQFVVGPRRATMLGGPVAVLAAALLVVVAALWLLGRLGLIEIETDEPE